MDLFSFLSVWEQGFWPMPWPRSVKAAQAAEESTQAAVLNSHFFFPSGRNA
jgi:hypothetical protein